MMLRRCGGGAIRWKGRSFSTGAGYEDYLRHLQSQVVSTGRLLESGSQQEDKDVVPAPESQPPVTPDGREVKYVSVAKLIDSPGAPKDPIMLFKDIDNIRALTQRANSPLALSDKDCSILVLQMLNEVKRGRRLMKDITAHFERMEAHPDFYKAGEKVYSLVIYNCLARDYPELTVPASLFGRMLQKGEVPSAWTYVLLARVQMHLPPVERPAYRDAFLQELEANKNQITPAQAKVVRFWIERLKWITDGIRLAFYALGLAASLSLLYWAVQKRDEERKERAEVEDEMMDIIDEKYYGQSTGVHGRSTAVLPSRGGLKAADVDD